MTNEKRNNSELNRKMVAAAVAGELIRETSPGRGVITFHVTEIKTEQIYFLLQSSVYKTKT